MAKINEFALLQMKMDSLQELIELKQEETKNLVTEYMEAYTKYLEAAGEMITARIEDDEEEGYYDCDDCRYRDLSDDSEPCFTCKAYSNWKARKEGK